MIGICGGFQMLARRIVDPVESRAGDVDGLGLLDLEIVFHPDKTLRQVTGTASGATVAGYEIHHGRVHSSREQPWIVDDMHGPEGAVRGAVRGTHWHGLLAADVFGRDLLRSVAAQSGRPGFIVSPTTVVDEIRAAQVDLMADLVQEHLDMPRIEALICGGIDPAVPVVGHHLD